MTETITPALACLREMRDEVVEQKEKTGECTLSYWRFSQPDIWKAMEEFASASDWPYEGADEEACRQELQTLFTKMNLAMVQQERTLLWPDIPEPVPNQHQWSVVFGGKYAVVPCSISEQLVDLLATTGGNTRVYIVSRTPAPTKTEDGKNGTNLPPANVIHFSKLHLDTEGGDAEFEQVMSSVVDDWEADPKTAVDKIPIVFYFTLAKHKGNKLPFQRNLKSANNFAKALEKIIPTKFIAKGIPWKLVITGTDATNPSTQQDPSFTVNNIPTTQPSYKIVEYNTVYASSKLYQFYSIATAVAKLTGANIVPPLQSSRPDNDGSLGTITKQLEDFIVNAGANGTYQENLILTDKELDQISNYWTQVVEVALQEYLQTAKDISICYTPLHRDPWTSMCLKDKSKGSPKKFMIQNIIWRLKNAISIDKAARSHF